VIGAYISSINPDFDFHDIQELCGSAESSILSYYSKQGDRRGRCMENSFLKGSLSSVSIISKYQLNCKYNFCSLHL